MSLKKLKQDKNNNNCSLLGIRRMMLDTDRKIERNSGLARLVESVKKVERIKLKTIHFF